MPHPIDAYNNFSTSFKQKAPGSGEDFIQAVAVGKTFINEESLKVERENSTFYRTRESLRGPSEVGLISEYSRSFPFALKEGV